MIDYLKEKLHFPIAGCFLFFAKIKLKRWNPRIVVVTGSSGKTTLLNLIESQLGNRARYSHKANSLFGVAFDILGLKRKTLQPIEWLWLILKTPFEIFTKVPKENIYIVEIDCYIPRAGSFLGDFLKPEVLLWLSSSRTHSVYFDKLVPSKFPDVINAIAYEHANLARNTKKLVLANGDEKIITDELKNLTAELKLVKKQDILIEYQPGENTTRFVLSDGEAIIPALVPEDVFYSIGLTKSLINYLGLTLDTRFIGFTVPPGRSRAFKGIKNTTLVDSTYNANYISMKAILHMFKNMLGGKKIVVLGDMLELGKSSQSEHEELAKEIKNLGFSEVYLFGELCKKYTLPKLTELGAKAEVFTDHQELLTALNKDILGGESILFKGSQSCQLDAPLEMLLLDRGDNKYLPRRERAWQDRREAMKLHL